MGPGLCKRESRIPFPTITINSYCISLPFQTYVGTYLIFLNPHKRLVLTSNEAIRLYAQRSLFKLPPHV